MHNSTSRLRYYKDHVKTLYQMSSHSLLLGALDLYSVFITLSSSYHSELSLSTKMLLYSTSSHRLILT